MFKVMNKFFNVNCAFDISYIIDKFDHEEFFQRNG